MNPEGISFIIPTHNNYTDTIKCIKSIITCKDLSNINYQIIVVDDFSNIDDFSNLENEVKIIQNKNIIMYRNEKNMGPSYSRNLGAKNAAYNYIFFLDSDTQLIDGSIDNFLNKIKSYDAIIGIYNHKPLNAGVFPLYKAMLYYHYFYKNYDYQYTTFHAACAGIKKSVFESQKGFNEDIKWGMDYENEEFGYRLTKNNFRIVISPKTIVNHNFPDAKETIKTYFNRVSSWVKFFFIRKHFESAGSGTPVVALGSISAFISTLLMLLYFINSETLFLISSLSFLFIHIIIFLDFYIFILKKEKNSFFQLFGIHFLISNVISLGAIKGLYLVIKESILKKT